MMETLLKILVEAITDLSSAISSITSKLDSMRQEYNDTHGDLAELQRDVQELQRLSDTVRQFHQDTVLPAIKDIFEIARRVDTKLATMDIKGDVRTVLNEVFEDRRDCVRTILETHTLLSGHVRDSEQESRDMRSWYRDELSKMMCGCAARDSNAKRAFDFINQLIDKQWLGYVFVGAVMVAAILKLADEIIPYLF